ncbi:hypothetical protein GCM10010488_24400 [Oerskovia jenensis]
MLVALRRRHQSLLAARDDEELFGYPRQVAHRGIPAGDADHPPPPDDALGTTLVAGVPVDTVDNGKPCGPERG